MKTAFRGFILIILLVFIPALSCDCIKCNLSFRVRLIIFLFDCEIWILLKRFCPCQMCAIVSSTDDQSVESRNCRCSSQMLHLKELLPPSAEAIQANQQQQKHQRPSLQHAFPSHGNYRGLLFNCIFTKHFWQWLSLSHPRLLISGLAPALRDPLR